MKYNDLKYDIVPGKQGYAVENKMRHTKYT